jgi:hypothetical protein
MNPEMDLETDPEIGPETDLEIDPETDSELDQETGQVQKPDLELKTAMEPDSNLMRNWIPKWIQNWIRIQNYPIATHCGDCQICGHLCT